MDLLALLVVGTGSATVGLFAGFLAGRRRGWRSALSTARSDDTARDTGGNGDDDDEQAPTTARGIVDALIAESIKRVGKSIQSAAAGEIKMAPDGTITLMFSDIEDSSTLNLKLGDEEWARVVKAHDEIVRAVVRSHGGRVIKTLGDGFMAAFPDPEEAALAGLELHAVLSSNDEVGHDLGLRIGVHTGPAVSRDRDLFGENVVIAARVGGVARAGEVLVTSVVRDRLTDSELVDFAGRRRVRWKGIPGRHTVYVATMAPTSVD